MFEYDGIDYIQIAVQAGNYVFASTIFPFKEFVSAGGVRKALFDSLESGKVIPFRTPPPWYKGVYKWVIMGTVTLGLVL